MDMQHELIEDSRYISFVDFSEIFDVAKLLTSKQECKQAKKPETRFFCNYKCEKATGKKYQLVPIEVPIVDPITLKNTGGNWKVTVNRIDDDVARSSMENVTTRTPSRRITSTKKTTPIIQDIFAGHLDHDGPPNKKNRSAKKVENRTPSTPKNQGIPSRRKSILKTPTTSKIGTPRRSIQFSNVLEDCEEERTYKKKSVRDKIATVDEEDDANKSDLAMSRKLLHVSAVPTTLPCREKEFEEIYSFLEINLKEECSGCIYVSGVPGTGKTATTTQVIRTLTAESEKGALPKFDLIEINGMRITEPRKAYVEMYRQLMGKNVPWEQAYNWLDKRFSNPSPRRKTTILIVDELDILCNKRQDVIYNLLNWPTLNSSRLIVVTIANTMDLPERVFMGKVASRIGLHRLTFLPYSFRQLEEIVKSRLSGLESFTSDAVQLVSRKIAALSGDARRALDICRRASEIAEAEEYSLNSDVSVSMEHVQTAIGEMISCPKVLAIKSCSKMEKLFLRAVCTEVERTGLEEVIFRGVYKQMEVLATFEDCKLPTVGNTLAISYRLGAMRLLICEHVRKDTYQKIMLNISPDDFYFATRKGSEE